MYIGYNFYCKLINYRIKMTEFQDNSNMIAARIKTLREQKGLTQSMLARKIGITRSSVNAWEMGISIPSTQYLIELAKLFNVSTDYLLGQDATSTIRTDGLNEEDVRVVLELIEHLRNK